MSDPVGDPEERFLVTGLIIFTNSKEKLNVVTGSCMYKLIPIHSNMKQSLTIKMLYLKHCITRKQ